MWPTNYELDNAYSVYSHQFYSNKPIHQPNGHPKSSPNVGQFDCDELDRKRSADFNRGGDRSADLGKPGELLSRTGEPIRTSADLGRCSSGGYQSPCSPKSQLPTRINSLNGNSFWPNYTSYSNYSNYNQIATAIAAVQTAVANSEPTNPGYSTNATHNSDSFRTRPTSSDASNNFYNSTTCLSLDLPGNLFAFAHSSCSSGFYWFCW